MADYSYSGWWGFITPRKDWFTNIIFDLLFITTIYSLIGKNERRARLNIRNTESIKVNIAPYLGLIAMIPPMAVIVLLHRPAMLYAFQWRELELFPTTGSYATIEKITYIAVSCSVLLLFTKSRYGLFVKLFSIACLLTNICIQGKRAILFFAIINIVIVLYSKVKDSKINVKKMLIIGSVCLALCVAFLSFMISMTVSVKLDRGYDPNNTSAIYTTTRIDFLRDDRVRLSIYLKAHPDEVQVMQYPTQSLWSDVFSFIPLNYVASAAKLNLYSYQTYFTHALERKKADSKMDVENHSYMTVTFISEIISNFGILLAFFILPYLCRWFANKAEKYPYPLNAMILCIFVSLNMFDFTYMAYYIEAVVVLCWLYNRSSKRRLSHA